jgi:hypothetical protein
MTYLLLQIALYLAAAFVLGVAFGWTLWGRRRKKVQVSDRGPSTDGPAEDTHALADALARVNREKTELARRLAELEKT